MGRPLRILIVEDSEDDALLMVRELRRGGYKPVFERVETADAMISALDRETPDLIIADYTMPHFSGPAALNLHKERDLDIPFILVSGNIGDDAGVEAMVAGAHDYICKSNLSRLVPAINRELREADTRMARKSADRALRKAHEELEERVKERTAQLSEAYESLQREVEGRKKVEDQLRQAQKMEAIGTLAGGIAHDFNNILAAVIGFAEMVKDDLPPESKSMHRIERVLTAASRGTELVRRILAFSRKAEHAREPVRLSAIANETAQLLRASLPATIEIKLSMKTVKDTVHASPVELQQILMNLATNASSAMKDRSGILGISITDIHFEPDSPVLDEDVEPGEYVQLTVTDTGHGMAPRVMNRIFEPFFTTKGVGEGTGMGLAMVYGIVKSLGGAIAVESEPEIGSTFRVFLPLVRTNERSEGSKVEAIPGGSERILFVDDEEMLTEWGQAVLENLGYAVTALTDSTEALNLFSSDPSRFDLVILDQTMPKLTGLNLAKKLLKIRPDIPIILGTGHSDSVSPQKAKEAGIREFMMKPLAREKLAEVIRRVLNTTGVQDQSAPREWIESKIR